MSSLPEVQDAALEEDEIRLIYGESDSEPEDDPYPVTLSEATIQLESIVRHQVSRCLFNQIISGLFRNHSPSFIPVCINGRTNNCSNFRGIFKIILKIGW